MIAEYVVTVGDPWRLILLLLAAGSVFLLTVAAAVYAIIRLAIVERRLTREIAELRGRATPADGARSRSLEP